MCFLRHECLGRNNKWSPSKAWSQLFLFHWLPAFYLDQKFCWIFSSSAIQKWKIGELEGDVRKIPYSFLWPEISGVVWLAETAISKQHDVRLRWPWRGLAGPKISMQKDETNEGYRWSSHNIPVAQTSKYHPPPFSPITLEYPSMLDRVVIGAGCINRCVSQASLRQEKLASCRSMTSAWLMLVDSSASPKLLVKVCLNHSIFSVGQVVVFLRKWTKKPGGVLNATVVGQTWYADRLINSGIGLSICKTGSEALGHGAAF